MCECYKIGGPFIAEDPECPEHGYAARAEQAARERTETSQEARIAALEEQGRGWSAASLATPTTTTPSVTPWGSPRTTWNPIGPRTDGQA